jgi:thioredoxin reductase (NADPH)
MADNIHDIVVIGAGPSSLAAAIYTTRDGFDTVLFEQSAVGGIVATIDKIDNYPGFPDGITGWDCADLLEKQAKRFGTQIEYGEVQSIRHDSGNNFITVDGKEIASKAILIASGCGHLKVGIPGEEELYGHGVSYCATCDGAFYVGKKLAVIGGANSAVQEAIYLTQFASHIDLLVRSSIKATEVLQENLQKFVESGKITVHLATMPQEIIGANNKVVGVRITNNGKQDTIDVDGVFVFVGLKPNTKFLVGSGVDLDSDGFVITDNKLETSVPGVFASGDVRSGSTRQIASAMGDGVTAALSMREFINSQK